MNYKANGKANMLKELDIEKDFINKLRDLKYTYREDIQDRKTLEQNFRKKFEELNKVSLTNNEFDRLLGYIIKPNVFEASRILRQQHTFMRDDGTPLDYSLVNIKHWCKNSFEVINQPRINTRNSYQQYDVILLINGVPVVQVELKRHNVTPRRAMQQIIDYKKDRGNGYLDTLMCFMQIFIISNQNETWYFSNNENEHFQFDAHERFLPIYKFADPDNTKIDSLDKFSEKFLAKCTLGETISRYMVLVATEKKLLIMRPYQIYAVQNIIECIDQNKGNGYIWHTTGSGKTLTSFKASTLLKDKPEIAKCLFVVDRKDLDKQTREEFNKFQEKCVEENTNTESLVQKLLSTDYKDKVIVTTIQKLGIALDENSNRNYKERLKPLADKRMVFIFDECHRSQFGDNHKAIKNFFPNAQLFGFTGTPIFSKNATYKKIEGGQGSYKTTEDIFENELHSYTIANAIDDRNVLKFHVDHYLPEGKEKSGVAGTLNKKAIIEAILNKHNSATSARKFNALFATSGISDAIQYYELFKQAQAKKYEEDSEYVSLNIACVFSPPASMSAEAKQMQEDLQQEKEDYKTEPDKKQQALIEIIADYNEKYNCNRSINEFDLYYQDVQQRIKDQQYSNQDFPQSEKIDITIVVDMLLTGFDAKYLKHALY